MISVQILETPFMRFLLGALTLASLTASAGTTLESVDHPLIEKRADTVATISAQDGNLRVESTGRDRVMIFKNDTIYGLDSKEKSYTAIDRATLQTMAERLSPALKLLANLPPEQRAQVQSMMGHALPGAGEEHKQVIRKTNRTDHVSGYSCTYVEMLQDDVLAEEFCVVPPGSLKGSQDLLAATDKMQALLNDVFKSLDAPWVRQMVEQRITNFSELGGVPVFTRHYENGKPASEITLRSVRNEPLPNSTFEIPPGYAKKDMMRDNAR
jgi:hypothetical protein